MLKSRKFEAIKKEAIKQRLFLFVLVYLVFITAYLSVNTLSKYVGTSKGEGTVQVAKWEVSAVSDSNSTMNIVAGNTSAEYKIKVTSTSEVACTYSIKLSNVPDNVIVKLDNEDPVTVTGGSLIFENFGHFDANSVGVENIHTLTISAEISTGKVDAHQVGIDVIFVQDNIE